MWLTLILRRLRNAGLIPQVYMFVATALVVILTSFTLIQYGEGVEKQHTLIEQNNKYISTRGKIDEATKSNPNGDPTIALERLRHSK